MIYQTGDIFFVIFHTSLILFNMFGWVWKKTRPWNFITLILTGASWSILGLWYGFGYCPCTDWHWSILRKLGKNDLPSSYITYLTERVTGFEVDGSVANTVTLLVYLALLIISGLLNWRDYRSGKISL